MIESLRLSAAALRLQSWAKTVRRRLRLRGCPRTAGRCNVCERRGAFVRVDENLRESPLCLACGSVPRQRALIACLGELGVDLARGRVHESSPSSCTWRFFRRHSGAFTASYWLPHRAAGARIGAFVNADLGAQPFADGAFDLVVTQDVFEHVPAPLPALREVHRTLAPGGIHVFTVPRAEWRDTAPRAVRRDGRLELLAPAEHHHDPVSRGGSLVITDWGRDLERVLADAGIGCTAHVVQDPGGDGAGIEVFVARRPVQ